MPATRWRALSALEARAVAAKILSYGTWRREIGVSLRPHLSESLGCEKKNGVMGREARSAEEHKADYLTRTAKGHGTSRPALPSDKSRRRAEGFAAPWQCGFFVFVGAASGGEKPRPPPVGWR